MDLKAISKIIEENLKNQNTKYEFDVENIVYSLESSIENSDLENLVFEFKDLNSPIQEIAGNVLKRKIINDIALKFEDNYDRSKNFKNNIKKYEVQANYKIIDKFAADKLSEESQVIFNRIDGKDDKNFNFISVEGIPYNKEIVHKNDDEIVLDDYNINGIKIYEAPSKPKLSWKDWTLQAAINNFEYITDDNGVETKNPFYLISSVINNKKDSIFSILGKLGFNETKINSIILNLIPFIRGQVIQLSNATNQFEDLSDEEKSFKSAKAGDWQSILSSVLLGMPTAVSPGEGFNTIINSMGSFIKGMDQFLSGKGIDFNRIMTPLDMEINANFPSGIGYENVMRPIPKIGRISRNIEKVNPFVEKLLNAPPDFFSNTYDTYIEIVPKNFNFKNIKTDTEKVKDLTDLLKNIRLIDNPLFLSIRIDGIDLPLKNSLSQLNDFKFFGTSIIKTDNVRDRDTRSKISVRADSKLFLIDLFDNISGTDQFIKNIKGQKKYPFPEKDHLQDIAKIFSPKDYKINVYVKKFNYSNSIKETLEYVEDIDNRNINNMNAAYDSRRDITDKYTRRQNMLPSQSLIQDSLERLGESQDATFDTWIENYNETLNSADNLLKTYMKAFSAHKKYCELSKASLDSAKRQKRNQVDSKFGFKEDDIYMSKMTGFNATSQMKSMENNNENWKKELEKIDSQFKAIENKIDADLKICNEALESNNFSTDAKFVKLKEKLGQLKLKKEDFEDSLNGVIKEKINYEKDLQKMTDNYNQENYLSQMKRTSDIIIDRYQKDMDKNDKILNKLQAERNLLNENSDLIENIVEEYQHRSNKHFYGSGNYSSCELFIFEDCRFLGTTNGIEFSQSPDPQKFNYDFIFKRFVHDTIKFKYQDKIEKFMKDLGKLDDE